MKNIVIIEDRFRHFQIAGQLVSDHATNVFPNNINSEQELCDFLTPVRAFIETTDATTRAKRIKEFFVDEHLPQDNNQLQVSLYIIDYQLLADNNNITGLKFCEYIDDIREGNVPAIILTIFDLSDIDVLKQKNEFTNKYPNSRIEFDRKVQNKFGRRAWNWDEKDKSIDDIVNNSSELSTRLKDTINRLCQTNRNNKHKKLEDLYEH